MENGEDFWQQEKPIFSVKQFFKNHFSDWLFLFIGFLLILFGLAQKSGWLEQEPVTVALSQSRTDSTVLLWVDIHGAVKKPGLYQLSADSRMEDLLQACGGPSRFASPEFIAQELNRARRLQDGEKVYIPYFTPPETATTAPQADQVTVDINRADTATLEALPGIGAVYAQRIVDWRRQNGSFSSAEELKQISGIGEKLVEQISDLITW